MRDVQVRLFFILLLVASTLPLPAQEVKVQGGFIEDGMKLGQDVHYWMSARYPEHLELILPDSNHNFSPFEFAGKTYFNSKLDGNQVLDSAVYVLQSYEIDNVQYLGLPAFILKSGDTSTVKAATDSILFFEMVEQVTDTTSLKENIAYQEVDKELNYPLYAIILGVILIISVIVFLVFGKRIKRALKLRKLKKDYIRFSEKLTIYIRELKNKPRWETAEIAITEWKRFLEKLEKKPYSTLTTKEIIGLGYTNELKDTLKVIDRTVYGKISNDEIYKEFQAIEDFTQHRYSVIIDQIKNG